MSLRIFYGIALPLSLGIQFKTMKMTLMMSHDVIRIHFTFWDYLFTTESVHYKLDTLSLKDVFFAWKCRVE